MKTYTIIKGFFAVGVLSVVLSGCSEDAMDRINKDHGHTQSVAGRFILTDVITSTAFSNAGGDLNTYLSSYIEYEVGVDNQLYYAETRESEPTSSSTFNNTWNNLYSTLKSARIIINQCSDGGIDYGNYTTKGMAEVLAAYNCALIADMFGDAPCSQAALVDENGSPVYLNPKMDKQEDIYKQAMQYLDDAIADLQQEDLIDPSSQDLLYQGDAEKWLKFAYALKARYTMHLLQRSTNKDADMEKVLEYVSKSFKNTEEQAAFSVYDVNNINPLYGFFKARAALGASESMRSKLAVSPEVVSFAFAKRSNPTRTRVITRKATIAMIIVNVIFLSLLKDYNLIPEKIMNAMPIRPVMMKAIPGPRSAAGICE